MKALVITAEYPPIHGGVATYLRNLASALVDLGHDVHVVTCAGEPGSSHENAMTVTRLRSALTRRYVKILPLLRASARIVRQDRPDVVICARLSHEGVVGWLLKRIMGARFILVVHGSEILQHRGRRAAVVVRALLRATDGLIANSSYTRELTASFGIEVEKIAVVHPTVNPTDFPQAGDDHAVRRRYRLEEKRVLLTVGQLTARKGHAAVMRAVAALRSSFSDLVYVVAGDAGEQCDALRALTMSLGIGDRVVFAGGVSNDELAALYRLADVFVLPSRELARDVEGFGIALLEASLFGKPIVAGIGGGTADVVTDGVTGLMVDGASDQDIQAAIVELLTNHDLGIRLGDNARARANGELSFEAQRLRLDDALRGIVPSRLQPSAAVAR